jgi:hypothetical protein
MPRYGPDTQEAIQVLVWCLQLLFAHAPSVDPDWAQHWTAIMAGGHFAGEYWHGPDGYHADWWARVIDDLLDFILTGRPDH